MINRISLRVLIQVLRMKFTIFNQMIRTITIKAQSIIKISYLSTSRLTVIVTCLLLTDPPPLPARVEHVNAVFSVSPKSDDPSKIQRDPPPPVVVNNKIQKVKPFKTSKKNYHIVETKEYPFREYIPKIPYPQRLKVDQSHLNRVVKES